MTTLTALPNRVLFLDRLHQALRRLAIGSELIDYSGVPNADVPSTLANGQLVRVRLQTTQVNGAWVAIRLRHGVRSRRSPPSKRACSARTSSSDQRRGPAMPASSARNAHVAALGAQSASQGYCPGIAPCASKGVAQAKVSFSTDVCHCSCRDSAHQFGSASASSPAPLRRRS